MEFPQTISLQSDALQVKVYVDANRTAYLQEIIPVPASTRLLTSSYFANSFTPLVEVRLGGEGTAKHKSSKSLIGAYLGTQLKYQSHCTSIRPGTQILHVDLTDNTSKVSVTYHLEIYQSIPVLSSRATIRNDGSQDIVVTQVSSLVLGGLTTGSKEWWSDYKLSVANNSWFRKAQWVEYDLPSLGIDNHGVYGYPEEHAASLAHYTVSNHGSFSTEGHLPMGLLKRADGAETWLWQVENNGSWRWEIGDWKDSVYLVAGGPVEVDHDWREKLYPGQSFTTVPGAICHVFDNYEKAFAELTRYRRQMRRQHEDHERLPIIFNDYMNCHMGDPTDQKILSLINPVVEAGAEYFVIDAGWYADDSGWWDDVGLWEPSKKRFPIGFKELLSQIKARGLTPGLWIEPEVVGIRTVVAQQLPDSAFFQRDGHRIVEKGRYQLDYRQQAVRDHMNGIIHRLITDFGVDYFKFDYNIEVTQGTDIDCFSPGSGQLEHNRAYLRWVNELHDKYPKLVIENCSSGAQRMDYAMLAVHALQSTSDQQNPYRYAAISAALPTAVAPEQGGVWAYPQPGWDDETNAMTAVNSLLGRIHLSGRLDELPPHQFDLIKEGMDVYRSIRSDLRTATAFWPLGLPHWHDDWIALGMAAQTAEGQDAGHYYISVWRRGGPELNYLPIVALRGQVASVQLLYPISLPTDMSWEASEGLLKVYIPCKMTARLLKVTVV